MESLVDCLRHRALETPDAPAYSFQSYRPPQRLELSWGELWRDACGIAAAAGPVRGETVLLLYPPGLDFHRAFFGALLAGAIPAAVQAPTPAHRQRTLAQVELAAQACSTRRLWTLERLIPQGWSALATDEVAPGSFEAEAGEIAYVQLTSGTTAVTRAVRISHANAVWMGRAIVAASEVEGSNSVAVGWLPMFHDLGLVLLVLCPLLAAGGRGHGLAPLDFLQRPERWLEALRDEGASHTAAPNFAYRLCLGLEPVALPALRRAFNGGEGVDPQMVEEFENRFRVPVFPCYGLAEATLMVSGAARARQRGSCGPPLEGVEVCVREERIFVRSPGVAVGEADVDGWLDTGDLGFVRDGELFVTGRAKEILVLHGSNYAPQYFEEACGWTGAVVAYSVPTAEGEGLVLEVEVPRGRSLERDLRAAVAAATGIAVHAVVERAPGQLARTTSGKLRRGECRRRYLEERA